MICDRCLCTAATAGATSAAVTTAVMSLLGGVRHGLAHQSESPFFGDIAKGAKVLNSLLTCSVLLTRNDASLVLHEIGLL